MIQVERQSEPAALERKATRGKNKGRSEREAVLHALKQHLDAGRPPEDFSYDYKVYKDDEVKDALDASFLGKCAYCETFYSASQPMDVEHWRPKGEIHVEGQDDPLRPGYYWLASHWQNLFPSCIDCNRARRQHDVIARKEILLGKANQFPLADEGSRARSHELSHTSEKILLIDPCHDQPERFFVYTEDGAIVPADDLDDADRQRALASIQVYALNRSALVAERLEVIRRIDHRLVLMGSLADLRTQLQDRQQDDLAEIVAELILAESQALDEMMEASSPFAGLARYLFREAQRTPNA